MGGDPIPERITALLRNAKALRKLCGISPPFGRLSPTQGHVSHLVLTSSPLYSQYCYHFRARLACLIHAASVRSEPGSNSPMVKLVSHRGLKLNCFVRSEIPPGNCRPFRGRARRVELIFLRQSPKNLSLRRQHQLAPEPPTAQVQ